MDHVGYIDIDGRIAHFHQASCAFQRNQLDVKALSKKCRFSLFGIPFRNAASVADLAGQTYGPADVDGDPIAESTIETKAGGYGYERVEVRCRSFDAAAKQITVAVLADVVD
ncbi:MAG TPA: hypothetical protein PLX97_02700 [Gemmatales bacterium]|nr:hypothetical protein [Gemmatales bacterium]